ncbi:MAG: M23 family metallopeptidase [Proteobacteria bacterium]|nr:M23 family metallopeptidase [Pseudomonadota bacterium]
MRRWAAAVFLFVASSTTGWALDLPDEFIQGALVMGAVEPGAAVMLDGKPLRVDARSGRFVFGIHRDRTAPFALRIDYRDGRRETRSLPVRVRAYDIERIDGLPPRKVSPSTKDMERIRREAQLISAARARDSESPLFEVGFKWPASGRISGRYGNQRILNGEPRRPHLGVDIAAPSGTPVLASAPGAVVLAEPDLFYTGGTVVLDHGHGLTTVYSHLERVDAMPGQQVAAGDQIGTVGSTGRSTGPHLDWRINWFDVRLDPELIAGSMPAAR